MLMAFLHVKFKKFCNILYVCRINFDIFSHFNINLLLSNYCEPCTKTLNKDFPFLWRVKINLSCL